MCKNLARKAKKDKTENTGSKDQVHSVHRRRPQKEESCHTYRIRHNFRHHGLWLFQNLGNIRSITIGGSLLGIRIDSERNLATSLATRITFGTNIDANTSTTRGWMHNVQILLGMILDGKTGDTKVTIFNNFTEHLSTRGNGSFLVTTTLASSGGATTGTFDRQEFGFGIVFLDGHGETVGRNKKGVNEGKPRR